MKSVFKILISCILIMLVISCGHRKAPTGGKVDTEQPTIAAISPEPNSDISEGIIEITFSKPIDRASAYAGERGIYFYPLINQKRYRWSDNTLRIEIEEELEDNTYYYLNVSRNIRDIRNNSLDKDYLYYYHTGNPENNRVDGVITYERQEDMGKEVTISVLSADSLRIFSRKFTGDRFLIDRLNNKPHILRAFIDKNNNNRYDRGSEPFFLAEIPAAQYYEVYINLEYFDDEKPELRSINVPYRHLLVVNLSKPVSQIANINIVSIDSLRQELNFIEYDFQQSSIEIITARMDSLTYELTLTDVQDDKGNIAEELKETFQASVRQDTTSLKVVEYIPRNGAVVETLKPALRITFSKYTIPDNVHYRLIDTTSGKEVETFIHRIDSRNILIVPENDLQSRQSYKLIISDMTTDAIGNNLNETFELNFLPIVNR